MPKWENDNDRLERIPEYDFEQGVIEIKSRIVDLLKRQPYAVVAFSGSSSNVGKTTLANRITQEMYSEHRLLGAVYRGIENIETHTMANSPRFFILEQLDFGSIVDDSIREKVRELHDKNVSSALDKIAIHISGIDFWVGIYRPDKPFAYSQDSDKKSAPIADFIIRNEEAVDKDPPV